MVLPYRQLTHPYFPPLQSAQIGTSPNFVSQVADYSSSDRVHGDYSSGQSELCSAAGSPMVRYSRADWMPGLKCRRPNQPSCRIPAGKIRGFKDGSARNERNETDLTRESDWRERWWAHGIMLILNYEPLKRWCRLCESWLLNIVEYCCCWASDTVQKMWNILAR